MAACCYFGVDLRNQLDHNFLSRSTNGTPYSSSDLLASSLLPFTWKYYPKSKSFSPFCSLEQNYAKSNSCPLVFGHSYSKSKFPLLFALPGLKILSPTPILLKYYKSNFVSELEKFPLFAYLFHTLTTGV